MDGNTVIVVPMLDGDPPIFSSFLGKSLLQRHIRLSHRMGADNIVVVCANVEDQERTENFLRAGQAIDSVSVTCIADSSRNDDSLTNGATLVLRAEILVEQPLLERLTEANTSSVLVDSSIAGAQPLAAWLQAPCTIAECAGLFETGGTGVDATVTDVDKLPTFNASLRRHRRSGWVLVSEKRDLIQAKEMLVDGAQKGSLDIPAKYLHAPIENAIVSRIAEGKLTPNQITIATTIAAWLMTWLIFTGHVWLGLIGAAVIGILDGVDGKLARLKLMTSRLGEMEHLLDMMFEYSWWLALGWTLSGGEPSSTIFLMSVGLILCNFGDTLAGVIFWIFRGRGVGRTIDNYSSFDVDFRLIGGRRNVYIWMLLLLGPIIGLDSAFVACFWWAVITVLVRLSRAILHVFRPRDDELSDFIVS